MSCQNLMLAALKHTHTQIKIVFLVWFKKCNSYYLSSFEYEWDILVSACVWH